MSATKYLQMLSNLQSRIQSLELESPVLCRRYTLLALCSEVMEVRNYFKNEVLRRIKDEIILDVDVDVNYKVWASKLDQIKQPNYKGIYPTPKDYFDKSGDKVLDRYESKYLEAFVDMGKLYPQFNAYQQISDCTSVLSNNKLVSDEQLCYVANKYILDLQNVLCEIDTTLNRKYSDEHFTSLFKQEQDRFIMSNNVLAVKNEFDKWMEESNYGEPSLEDLKEKRANVLAEFFDQGAFCEEAEQKSRTRYRNTEIDFGGMDREEHYRRCYEELGRLITFKDDFINYDKDVHVGKYFYYHRKDTGAEAIRTAFFACKRFVELIQDEMKKQSGANLGRFDLLPESRMEIIRRIEKYIDRGDWQEPATRENIKAMMRQVLGVGTQMLTADEETMSKILWDLFETGQGKRVSITFSNLIGYFAYYQYLPSNYKAPKLSQMFFRNEENVYQNINKGRPGNDNLPPRFGKVITLLDTYRPKAVSDSEQE